MPPLSLSLSVTLSFAHSLTLHLPPPLSVPLFLPSSLLYVVRIHAHTLTHSLTHSHTHTLQDSEIFCSIDSSEYIADLWRNPNHLTKENLQKFEGVSHSLEASLTLGAHAQRGLLCHSVRPSVCLSVCLSVCYHVFWHYAQQGGQKAIPMGSVPHWIFKMAIFVKVLRSRVMA